MRGKKTYKPNANGKYEGWIYRRYVDMPGSEYNGKSYIGATTNPKVREQKFKSSSSNYAGKKLKDAIENVPYDNWKYEELETIEKDTVKELEAELTRLETQYIEQYNSYEDGFNGNKGGTGNTGVVFDEARRKQNGDNRRNKPMPEEAKQKISAANKGKTLTDATKAKISAGNTGKKRTTQQNAAQAARMKGTVPTAACAAAKEWHEQHPGGYWKNHLMTNAARANMSAAQLLRARCVKATFDDGSIICFPSLLHAAKHFDMGAGSITHFIKAGTRSEKAKARFEEISHEDYDLWKASNP
jgi:group I intron endonuclease